MLRRTIPALHFHTLLLLIALFNALAGVPMHEARHIREAERGVQTVLATASGVEADAADATSFTANSDEPHGPETHATCAWCLTHALDTGLTHAATSLHSPPTETAAALAQRTAPFTAQQVRWPFAARDPPPAQRA